MIPSTAFFQPINIFKFQNYSFLDSNMPTICGSKAGMFSETTPLGRQAKIEHIMWILFVQKYIVFKEFSRVMELEHKTFNSNSTTFGTSNFM